LGPLKESNHQPNMDLPDTLRYGWCVRENPVLSEAKCGVLVAPIGASTGMCQALLGPSEGHCLCVTCVSFAVLSPRSVLGREDRQLNYSSTYYLVVSTVVSK
jgi:hypothetical protein